MAFVLVFFLFMPGFAMGNSNQLNEANEIMVKYKNKTEIETIKINPSQNVEKLINLYEEDPLVEYAEPNYIYHSSIIPSDTNYNNQWYLQKIQAIKGWDIIRESPKIVIAVIDSGTQIDHPDLKNNLWYNSKEIPNNKIDDDKNGFIDDVNGWDFINGVGDPSPKYKSGFTEDVMHGTIVSGIIGAEGNNATGISGVTWKTELMPLKILNDKGEGSASNVIKAIDYAVANGAHIINLSFVGFGYSYGMDEAIKRAYDAGVIVVAAAGNEANTNSSDVYLNNKPLYPVCLDGRPGENRVIGVAATDTMDQKTYFSGYGSNCIDIAAPGVSIFSTVPYSPTHQVNNQSLNKYYDGYWSGTSVATPIVSGAIALIEAANPKLDRNQVIDVLLNTSDNINKLNPKYVNQLGKGRLNLQSALNDATSRLINTDNIIVSAAFTDHKNSIKVLEKNNIYEFSPYLNYFGKINLTNGDVDGDGKYEIITSQGGKGNSLIKIFSINGLLKKQFFAYKSNFKGGVNVAVGDINGDGKAEIITGAGPGGGPHVKIFNYSGKTIGQFFAYKSNFKGGVNVAVGDINGGTINRKVEIITAPSGGYQPEVKVFNDHGIVISKFLAFNQNFTNGVSISAADINKDGMAEIITGAGPGGAPHIRVFQSNGKLVNSFYAFDPEYKNGITVGYLEEKQN